MGSEKSTVGRDPKLLLLCYICGDTARGNNFSVLSCVSCKSFFRRHGLLQLGKLDCRYQGNCLITKDTRSNCQHCRLKKCLDIGMDPKMIRCPSNHHINLIKIRQSMMTNQKKIQLLAPKPLSLLQNDRSTLTTDQWSLLSNIIRSYDEENVIDRVKCLLHEKSSLPPKLRSKPADTIDFISQSLIGIQPLIEHSPHFHYLSNNARRALVLHNMYFTSCINGHFIARETDTFRNTMCMTATSALFGSDHMKSCAQDNERLEQNGSLIKIMLFVLIFSSNYSIVVFNDQEDIETISSSIELIQIQNIYVTMLWKHLVYLYGYDQAAIRFCSLIKSVIDMLHRAAEVSKNLAYNTLLDRIVTQTERSLAIHN